MSPYFVPAGKEGAEDMTWQSNKPWCGIVNGSDSKMDVGHNHCDFKG